jgi:lysophospholipase L1-like esterase
MVRKVLKNGQWICLLALMAMIQPARKKITVWLAGDSTMCRYDSSRFPLTGWGMPFADYFDSSVTVENRAKGGRSTRTFLSENRWQSIMDHAGTGDYVLIQFGHNDESENYPDRYTTPEDYRRNLIRFITETRRKKAIPVLLTPVSRRKFDTAGNAIETHAVYSAIVREVAIQNKVPLIDLDQMSLQLIRQFGAVHSAFLFNQLQPGENPNYPQGVSDNTHFNAYGARRIAELVLQGIQDLHLGLANRIEKKNN